MSTIRRILYYFVLPTLALMIFPPSTIGGAPLFLVFATLLGVGLGYLVWRGRSLALTMTIFVQGMNVIIRLMMLFPNASLNGVIQPVDILTNIVGMAISFYMLLRLDQSDVRVQMVD